MPTTWALATVAPTESAVRAVYSPAPLKIFAIGRLFN